MIKIHASLGEVLDKISILRIKTDKIISEIAQKNVRKELSFLTKALDDSEYKGALLLPQYEALAEVNLKLWLVEDNLREMEKSNCFDSDFVELARLVYRLNDRRAEIKRELNVIYGSALIEEKSYQPY